MAITPNAPPLQVPAVSPTGSNSSTKYFTLGNVVFTGREVPENLGDMGGQQHMVVHVFPGGDQTAQLLGATPADKEWTGELFGAYALNRARQLEQLYINAQGVNLVYDSYDYLGVVEYFKILIDHNWYIKYTIKFRALQDNSNGGASMPPVANIERTLAQAQSVANQQVNAPAVPYTFGSDVTTAVSNMQTTINTSMGLASGLVGNLTSILTGQIQQSIGQVQNLLIPSASGLDPLAASAARDLLGTLQLISNLFGSASGTITTLNITNPNLFELAAVYYQDASLWNIIASANGLLDPQPLGNYTLTIPSQPPSQPSSGNLFTQ